MDCDVVMCALLLSEAQRLRLIRGRCSKRWEREPRKRGKEVVKINTNKNYYYFINGLTEHIMEDIDGT